MFDKISDDGYEEAIRYLMDNIPKECLKKVFVAVQNKGSLWWLPFHMGFGMYVRNVLRNGGFKWDAIILDELWYTLIEEAARRVEITKA